MTDSWGILDADAGLLVREAGPVSRVVVAAPTRAEGGKLSGDGWTVVLNPGFQAVPGARKGDFVSEEK